MTDAQFIKLINRTSAIGGKYRSLLTTIESEYARRYGCNPSDAEDDCWIDNLHVNPGGKITMDDVIDGVKYAGLLDDDDET